MGQNLIHLVYRLAVPALHHTKWRSKGTHLSIYFQIGYLFTYRTT